MGTFAKSAHIQVQKNGTLVEKTLFGSLQTPKHKECTWQANEERMWYGDNPQFRLQKWVGLVAGKLVGSY